MTPFVTKLILVGCTRVGSPARSRQIVDGQRDLPLVTLRDVGKCRSQPTAESTAGNGVSFRTAEIRERLEAHNESPGLGLYERLEIASDPADGLSATGSGTPAGVVGWKEQGRVGTAVQNQLTPRTDTSAERKETRTSVSQCGTIS
jgi:hypothetical protein